MEFGPYRIVKRLAAGGMGEVFLATLERVGGFQKEVAVKSIHPKYMTNPRFVEFFEREARLAALLNHRHIVQIFEQCSLKTESLLNSYVSELLHFVKLFKLRMFNQILKCELLV